MNKKKTIRNWHRKIISNSMHSVIVTILMGSILILVTVNNAVAGEGNPVPNDVTNLTNNSYEDNYINWTWSDPNNIDPGLLGVSVYIDGQYMTDVPGGVQYYNATNFAPNTQHTISTQTYDTRGHKTDNVLVNDIEWTAPNQETLTPTPTPTDTPTPTPTPTPTATPIPSNPIQHVVTIVFENQELNDILANGPYFNYLYNTYGSATNYYAACHPSASNYLAMTSGNTWECGSDAINLYSTKNIGTILETKNISQGGNLSWYGFMESMPAPCYRSDSGEYAPRHNPFVFYSDLVNTNLCEDHDVSLDVWTNLVNSGDSNEIPTYSFISPNLLNDGHDTSVEYADNWLKGFLDPLLSKPWAQNTVFFIVFDEGVTNDGFNDGFNGFNGGHTYLVAVSPYSKGLRITSDTTEYNLLTTIEWLLNLGTTGNNDDPSKYPPLKELFNLT